MYNCMPGIKKSVDKKIVDKLFAMKTTKILRYKNWSYTDVNFDIYARVVQLSE